MRKRLLTAIVLTILSVAVAKGQPNYFKHYEVEEGLSNNAVICSVQDHRGFMWFGTKDGLNRFDGYSFKTFRHVEGDTASLGSNFISSLHVDHQGTLWVGCDQGLYRYEAATERFHSVPGAPAAEIMDIQLDQQGRLWFTAGLKLYRYAPPTGTLVFRQAASFPATSLCSTPEGVLWVATAAGMIGAYSPQADSFTFYPVFDPEIPAGTRWIEEVYAGGGQLFIGTSRRGARTFDPRTRRYRDLALSDGDKTDIFVRDFIYSGGDDYWIATESGIFLHNSKSGRSTLLKKSFSDPYSLSDNAVYTLCRDREGGIWAGTYFGGLNYFSRQYTFFTKYFPRSGGNSISGHAVREIRQDRYGALWIGTEDAGLNRLDTTGRFTHYLPGSGKGTLAHSNIHGLLIDGDELWVGTFHHGLDVLDVRTGKVVRHYSAVRDSLRSDFVYCLYKTRAGRILAGTNRGVSTYDRARDRFSTLRELPGTFYTTLYEDRHGTLWAGTYNQGVHFYNPRTGEKGHFKNEPGNARSLPGKRVNQVFEDSKGTLWIATEGGLSRLDPQRDAFTSFTTRTGFPSNIIYQVLEDSRQRFWVSTSRGLVCFSPESGRTTTYTKESGLLNDQFNYHSAYRDPHGRMYFGSGKGLISFHPGELASPDYVLPVYFTGFQLNGRELPIGKTGSPLKKSITCTSLISLRHDQSSFSIDFAALGFTAPGMTEYSYKMEGLDRQWTYLKTNRRAYFTGLPPGTYTFKVKASTGGTGNSAPAVLRVEILPPFWKTIPAYVLYTLIGTLVLLAAAQRYQWRAEEKNRRNLALLELEKEKAIYTAKVDFFTHAAHEIRTPLTLIKAPMEIVMERAAGQPALQNSLRIMERNMDHLLELTGQLMDFRKIETHGFSLTFSAVDAAALLRDQYQRFQPAARRKGLSFALDVPEILEVTADEAALGKILGNLLGNALKYAHSRITVHLLPGEKENTSFAIEVRNDGHPIPFAMKERIFEPFVRLKETEKIQGTGIGLALSRSLAELHQGTLELLPPEGELNVFRLTLPVHPQNKKVASHPFPETTQEL